MVEVLEFFGVERVLVVYGLGMDEVFLYREIFVLEVGNGVERYMFLFEDFGIEFVKFLLCFFLEESVVRIKVVLGGLGRWEDRDFIFVNVLVVFYVLRVVEDFREGFEMVREVLG